MNNSELKKQRLQLIHDAVKMEKKPARVPHLSNAFTWVQQFSGAPLSVSLRDYAILEQTLRKFQEDYRFDALCGVGLRNPLNINDPMGVSYHEVDDEKAGIVIKDHTLMRDDEYDLFIQDMNKFLWEVVMPRKFLYEGGAIDLKAIYKSGLAFKEWLEYRAYAEKMLDEQYGVPATMFGGTLPVAIAGIEYFFNYYRGIVGLSKDLRKSPEKLLAACQVVEQEYTLPVLQGIEASPNGSNNDQCFDIVFFCLAHTILNPKQFDKFYWPVLDKTLKLAVQKNKTVFLYTEGKFDRFFDYLKDIPKGHVCLQVEQDDIFEARKQLPNICLAGGMPVELLGSASQQDCVNYAKKLVEELGADGGFIMSQDKMMTFKSDCIPENLKAVSDYIVNGQ